MTVRLCVLAAALLAASGTGAAELTPGTGHSLRIGQFTGVLYYSVETGGYRVIATIAEGESGKPVRFLSLLADGQTMAISVPREEGQADDLVEIARAGDRLLISRQARRDDVLTMNTPVAAE